MLFKIILVRMHSRILENEDVENELCTIEVNEQAEISCEDYDN